MIRISSIYEVSLEIMTFIMLGGLQLFPNSFSGGYAFRFFAAIVGVILAIACIATEKRNALYSRSKKAVNILLIPYAICICISCIYTAVMYNYSTYELTVALMPFLYVFYTYPIIYVISDDRHRVRFIKRISIITTCFLIIRFIAWLSYNQFGITIFPQLTFEYGEDWKRNGLLRIYSGYLIGLSFSYFLACFLQRKKKILAGLVVAFHLFFVAFVSSSRYQLITFVIVLLVAYYCLSESRKSRLQKILFIILIVTLLLFSPFVEDLLFSLSMNNTTETGTAMLRVLTIKHFWDYLISHNPFLGLGLLIPENAAALSILKRSYWGVFYLEDIGILGGIFKLGLLSLGVYLPFSITAIRTFFEKQHMEKWDRLFIVSFISYYLVSMLLLNPFDLQRAYDIPFYFGIICCYLCRYKRRRVK